MASTRSKRKDCAEACEQSEPKQPKLELSPVDLEAPAAPALAAAAVPSTPLVTALTAAAAPPTAPSTALTAAAAPAATLTALLPAARAALIERAGAALEKAKKGQKEEAVDGALRSSFQCVEAGGALAAVQSLCDPLDDSSLSAARNAFYYEETGKRLKSHGKPPPTALWPGHCEQPPGGRVILLPGFKNQGAETTLRKQWWLRAGVALANCIRRGQRMAIARCKILSGANEKALALIMYARSHSLASPKTCVLTGLDPYLQQRGRRKGAGARHAGGRLRFADGARGRARPDVPAGCSRGPTRSPSTALTTTQGMRRSGTGRRRRLQVATRMTVTAPALRRGSRSTRSARSRGCTRSLDNPQNRV